MELRVLRYFLVVAREESITRAADYLHLTQPTLSRQLMDLEKELGKKLFVRGSRRVSLTEEGMLLRKRAGEMIELEEKTLAELQQDSEAVSGDVFIGAGETDAMRMVGRAACQLRREGARVCCHLYSGNSIDVSERLDRGLLDFGILLGAIDTRKYDSLLLPAKDIWGVLMPAAHPLAKKKSIRAEELWDEPLILSRQGMIESDISRWLKKETGQLHVAATYNLVFNASLMVKEGVGLALTFDRLVGTGSDSGLAFRPLSPKVESGMQVVWKKYQVHSRAAERFLEALRAQCEAAE